MKRLKSPNSFQCNNINVILSFSYSDEFFKLIESAKKEVILHSYIFEFEATGKKVIEALYIAQKRGVYVQLVVDAVGSITDLEHIEKLCEYYQINLIIFGRLFNTFPLLFGRRLHQKLLVIDEKYFAISGINIGDEYFGKHKESSWLDLAVIVESNLAMVLKQWCLKALNEPFEVNASTLEVHGNDNIKLLFNDWLKGYGQITKSYMQYFDQAQTSIYLINGYFLPRRKIFKKLIDAGQRGVLVKIIVPGKSDIPIMRYASRYLYTKLLRNGIKLYEWEHSVLHAKAINIDQHTSCLGSYNLNYTSQFGCLETNLEFKGDASVKLYNIFEDELLALSKEITYELIKRDSLIKVLRDFASFYILQLIEIVSIFSIKFIRSIGRKLN